MTLKEIFEALAEENGGALTVEGALEAAEQGSTPAGKELAERLEWDDEVAGEHFRRMQIAHMIRSVRMRVVFRDAAGVEVTRSVRQFHAVPTERGPSAPHRFVPLSQLAREPESQAVVMAAAERDLRSIIRKYEHLHGFFAMAAEVIAESTPPGQIQDDPA